MSSCERVSTAAQPGIEVWRLHSDIIKSELQLWIKLPWRYPNSRSSYPVLYALDGNRSFFLYSTMSFIYETPPSESEEVLIVGIGYTLDEERIKGLAEWGAFRTRDLTPVRRDDVDREWEDRLSALLGGEKFPVRTGGAGAFLRAILEEVIPLVETGYRASSDDRGLAGYSYGGLFALYALFHAHGNFRRFFAGSPSFWEELFDFENEYAACHKDLEATLLMTVGGLEADLQEPFGRMADQLRSRQYPGLELHTWTFPGESHESAYAASVSRALHVLYGGGHATS